MGKKKLWVAPAVCAGVMLVQAPEAFAADDVQTSMWIECEGIYQEGDIGSTSSGDVEIDYVQVARNTYLSQASALTVNDVLYNGMLSCAERIDISSYNISKAELQEVFQALLNQHADLFHVAGGYRLSVSSTTGNVVAVVPSYLMTGDELAAAKEIFDTKMNEILMLVEDEWSDLEKAMFLHDYIASHFEYDLNYEIYDSYGFLTEGTGVCQAYTLTYNYLLKEVGINGSFASSEEMNHIWNMIQIDGSWYHVDVTWDDPTDDTLGKAEHSNFLRSDTGIGVTKHYGWVSEYTATSKKFDDAFWQASDAPLVWEDGQWYCLDDDGLKTCDVNKLTEGSVIYQIQDYWSAGGNSYYVGVYGSLGEYGGKLYFNGPSEIYEYDIATDTVKAVCELSLASGTSIYGILLQENVIWYGTSTSPSEKIVANGSYELPVVPDVIDVPFEWMIHEDASVIVCKGEEITPANLKEVFGSVITVCKDSDVLTSEEAVGTGCIVYLGSAASSGVPAYDVIVKGDTNGDAKVDVGDMEAIQKHILQIQPLEGVYWDAGWLTGSEEVLTVSDMEMIQKYIMQLIEW